MHYIDPTTPTFEQCLPFFIIAGLAAVVIIISTGLWRNIFDSKNSAK